MVIDLFRNADVEEAFIQAIIGLKSGTSASKYGSNTIMETKLPAIKRITSPLDTLKVHDTIIVK